MPTWAWILLALALLLATAWTYSRIWLARAKNRQPPTGDFLTVDNVHVHHIRRGEGPLVLFLHGLAGFLEDFTQTGILDALEADADLVAIDRPGYGHSTRPTPDLSDPHAQADWIANLIHELGHDEAILVGHSLGGAIATTTATRHPDTIRGLLLLAPYVYPYTEPDNWIHTLPRLLWIRRLIGHTLLVPIAHILEPWIVSASFAPQPIPADYHDLWLDKVLQPEHFETTTSEIRRIDPALAQTTPHYATLEVPTIILTGDEDESVDPTQNARRLVDELPHAELGWFEGYGHMLPWTHPDAIVHAIRRLLTQPSPRTTHPDEDR